jgi:copper chaperone NosL
MKILAVCLLVVVSVACGAAPQPAALDTRNDTCGACRMTVSSVKFAAQVVAPGEEPVFFDDLGCFSRYLRDRGDLPRGAVGFVADHRTGEWVPAGSAVFSRVLSLETPMGSHLIAHASALSRDSDPLARGGVDVPREQVSVRLTGSGLQ